MKLSVIIVNYNVKYFLEQCLLSVKKAMADIDGDIWVVDNHSKDGSVEMVNNKFPDVNLIANQKNTGFSVANNQAIKASTAEYILLLNPDTIIAENCLLKALAFIEKQPNAGGLGIKMIDGSGTFLPESKRGFPSPFVAFSKVFGLSSLFPNSKLFNRYHLGYLNKNKNHPVDVLAGAFMLIKKSVIEKIGLLDETFFMYGEDIDLSYRIEKAGYQNYYFADTPIIHYKGESTKKGSLNYVKVFYQAMIIFAKKHFRGGKANFFVLFLQLAIYFRAFLTVVSNWKKQFALPLFELFLMVIGLVFVKSFWSDFYHHNPNYYPNHFYWINIPTYVGIWLSSIYFSGSYDEKFNLNRLFRGLFVGTLLSLAVYGLLEMDLRSSRVLLLMGAAMTLVTTTSNRLILHFIKYKHFKLGQATKNRLAVVGNKIESNRVLQQLRAIRNDKNYLGFIGTNQDEDKDFLGNIKATNQLIDLYGINELIFCAKDVSFKSIIQTIEQIGDKVQYKIVTADSNIFIGSHSKNSQGELYTLEIDFAINSKMSKRNKRVVDLLACLFFSLSSPILLIFKPFRKKILPNLFAVLLNKKTWIGYDKAFNLPSLKKEVFTIYNQINQNESTLKRMAFLYAKDYSASIDVKHLLKNTIKFK